MSDGARWSLHVLDTMQGRPATGLRFTLRHLDRGIVLSGETDGDGRATGAPIAAGTYELLFEAGTYLVALGQSRDGLFFDQIPIRFMVEDGGKYHVPLILSAFGYTTYRGS